MEENPVVTNQDPTAFNTDPINPDQEPAVVEEDPTLLGPEKKEEPSPEVKGDGEPGEGEPKKEEEPKAEVPEKYDVSLPEGMDLDETTLELFTPIFKELGITNDGAQKLVEAYVPLIQSTIDRQREESQDYFKSIIAGWKTDTMTELGPKAKDDLAACGRAINKFGGDDLRTMLQETGVGNHKELVKFMAKIGRTISEDSVVDPNQPHNLDSADPRRIYTSMPQ